MGGTVVLWEDYLYLGLSLIQLMLGLALLLPPHVFLRPHFRSHPIGRPWRISAGNIMIGLAGVFLSIPRIWTVPTSIRTTLMVIASLQIISVCGLVLWLIVRIRRNGQSARQQTDETRIWIDDAGNDDPQRRAAALAREVRTILAQSNHIVAIKHVRERTGWGLHHAKDFVDSLVTHSET